MKICISGAQSTGKSTLLNSIKKDKRRNLLLPKYEFFDELTRKLYQEGVSINRDGDNLTQLLTLNVHVNNIVYSQFVSDRSILDAVCYTHYLYSEDKVSDWVMNYATKVLQEIVHSYDRIYYLPNELKLEDDGVRDPDEKFRLDIVELFEYYIEEYNLPVITLTGSVEERTDKFFDTL